MNTVRKPMRIVGYCNNIIFIQRLESGNWIQFSIGYFPFFELLEREFPDYLEEYYASGTDKGLFAWFFDYGTYNNGDTYIFR